MAMLAKDLDAIDYIWEQNEKQPDGTVKYSIYDVNALWELGFVDTKEYPQDVWVAFFDRYKQPDGNYILTKNDFYSLDQYRYKGEIKIPFDALMINEGKYTDEGFQRLIDLSIEPSCGLPVAQFTETIRKFTEKYRGPDGMITIGKNAKIDIKKLLQKYPSPMRRLEIIFDAALTDKVSQWVDQVVQTGHVSATTATKSQLARAQASAFSMLPSSNVEDAGKQLKNLTKSKEKKVAATGDKGVQLKKIKRSRKGVRG